MRKLDIEGMKLDYILDTKGYYQPIYKIDVRVNGEDNTILMPGIQN